MSAVENRYTLREFVEQTQQRDRGEGFFEMESPRILEVNLKNNFVWSKMGSMISYLGNMKFEREGMLDKGLGGFFKKAITGEGARLTKVTGTGKVYLADYGKKIQILRLENQEIVVNANDILAFEDSVDWDIKMMKRISSMMAGGLFQMTLSGTGMVAITTHYEPLTLVVTPDQPVYTDPNATVAWSGTLQPNFKTDISFRTLIGRSSGESFQMEFVGNGFVVVQPFEEVYHAEA
ncbi:AIM24 family protein [Bremerella sp. T1]|uniref:AIM24 family protein n=1 Tax=Bremerella sp. TYQ1 TaxID=3119568 RepID=UPI001CCAD67B|nr:AIM24 family protein [Bremerella volcania]UBM34902.1 AIM24 family protein [Bremerella volcania]